MISPNTFICGYQPTELGGQITKVGKLVGIALDGSMQILSGGLNISRGRWQFPPNVDPQCLDIPG